MSDTPAPPSAEALYASAAQSGKHQAANDFNQARDGLQSEKQQPTEQVQKSVQKLDERVADPKTSRGDIKAAETEVAFNVNAAGQKTTQTMAEAPPTASQDKPYTSQATGVEYSSDMGKEAAKNLDSTQTRSPQQTQKSTTSHHAPAPSPSWAGNDNTRGRSTEPTNTPNAGKKELPDWAKDVVAEARKNISAEQGNQLDRSQSTSQEMGR